MGNRKKRRTRKTESQSPEKDEITSKTSLSQEPSQFSNEIEVISQRLTEQNNTKMTQIEEELNNKFEEILKKIRTNRNSTITTYEEDAESSQTGPSNSTNKSLWNTHAANTTIDEYKTSRERPKSALYLRLKIVKGGLVGFCETPAGGKILKKLKGGPFKDLEKLPKKI